jgi:1-deoxy-D-xylulose-5-phosphate synthase
VLVHAITTKGKGYKPAESDLATRGHGLSFFDVATGESLAKKPAVKSYTDLFAEALCEQMERDPRVVAITAAMLEGTGLIKAKKRFPERTYDVGIAEQHAVTFAAGLACEGLRPVVAIYSTFLQRAFDQIVHDVALQNLPVTFALDRGGLVGADGKTHQGAFDLSYLRCVPNMVVMAPSDENEMRHMLATALAHDGPAAFRFPRAQGVGVRFDPVPQPLEIGKARIARESRARPDLVILSAGTALAAALKAADALAEERLAVTVVDARFVKPLDEDLVCALASAARRVVTVEESALAGGFGSACLEAFERRGILPQLRVRRLGLPDEFITHGDAEKQRAQLHLDAAGIASAAREMLGDRTVLAPERGAA